MKKHHNFSVRQMTAVLMGVVLALCFVLPTSGLNVSASSEPPAAWTELAKQRIPKNLKITLHGIEKKEGYTAVTGTAQWDDNADVNECEFNPWVLVGGNYARPKCTAWTIVKCEGSSDENQNTPDDVMYDVENGDSNKKFELMYVDENEEIEVWDEGSDNKYASGVKLGSQLRFTMTSVVGLDGYYGESPESEAVEFTLSEDVFGKTFSANSGSGGGSADSGVCKWCGEVHEGFWGGIVGFFHDVFYFFAHLFD